MGQIVKVEGAARGKEGSGGTIGENDRTILHKEWSLPTREMGTLGRVFEQSLRHRR